MTFSIPVSRAMSYAALQIRILHLSLMTYHP
jgi:hypothetical protein